MPDLHVRILRQVARIRRRRLLDAQEEAPRADGATDRLRQAAHAQSRADARLAAAAARRRLPDRS